jgi:hypothetical protein
MVKKGPPSPRKGKPAASFNAPSSPTKKSAENRFKRNALDYQTGNLLPYISLIVLSVTLVFSGILTTPGKIFLNYDDYENFSNNDCIRGISLENIICAFTRQTMGVYVLI